SVVNDPGNCAGGTVFWTAPSATDNCGGTVSIFDPTWSSGDLFPIGITAIEYTAEDSEGNTGTCNFTIEVYILDADNDGVCDEFDLCTGPEPGTTCDDGDPLTFDDVIGNDCICAGTANYVDVAVIMLLDGPYDPLTDLMKDDLRANALSPPAHPFATAPFSHTGTETITSGILADLGADAIVDWVLIELRDHTDPTMIVASRAALLQRDGDVVDLDGTSAVRFNDHAPGGYHVAVRHRNH